MNFSKKLDFFNSLVLSEKNLNYNLKIIKEKAKNKKICVMVKANAYGHSLKWIVLKLKNKVDFFGVSNASEALAVRQYSTKSKILVCGKASQIKTLIENGISLTIFSLKSLREVTNVCKTYNLKAKVHIKLNTGMNRLGISTNFELKKVVNFVMENSNFVEVEGVYSHLFNAKNQGLARTQYYKFIEFLNYAKSLGLDITKVILHLENSDGLFENVDFLDFCSMVRIGIALYGLENENLRPVLSLFSQIVATTKVNFDDFVGYGKTNIEQKGYVGVVPIGYADGIGRNYINSFVVVNNIPCKILNVCMDNIIIDLSNCTFCTFKIGDVVEIISTNNEKVNSVQNIAKNTNQISYEVITNINQNRLNLVFET